MLGSSHYSRFRYNRYHMKIIPRLAGLSETIWIPRGLVFLRALGLCPASFSLTDTVTACYDITSKAHIWLTAWFMTQGCPRVEFRERLGPEVSDLTSRIISLLMTSLGGGTHPRKIHCISGPSMSLFPGCHVPRSSFLCHEALSSATPFCHAALPHYSPLALD